MSLGCMEIQSLQPRYNSGLRGSGLGSHCQPLLDLKSLIYYEELLGLHRNLRESKEELETLLSVPNLSMAVWDACPSRRSSKLAITNG